MIADTKKALAEASALMARRNGLDEMDTVAVVHIAAGHYDVGNSAASAYEQARKLIIYLRRDNARRKVIELIGMVKANLPKLQAG